MKAGSYIGDFMAFDFTPDETDNALYWNEVNNMTREEKIEAYIDQMKLRGQGGDAAFNIQMPLDILLNFANMHDFEFPETPDDHTIYGYIRQVDTPDSKSLEGYGYDYYTNTVYIKYRSGAKVYSYPGVPFERFKIFETSESKGKEAVQLRKEFGSLRQE